MNRAALFQSLGVIKVELANAGVAERTTSAYEEEILEGWKAHADDSPHGAPWHTSFHASSFPDVDVGRGCARKAVYGLLNAPPSEPTPAWLVAISDAGKDIETQIVRRWHKSGILLTAPPSERYQTNFVDPLTWLTCSVDAALDLRPGWRWVHPVDVKGKDHTVIESMQRNEKQPDPGHVRQIMVQTFFLRRFHVEMGWDKMGLEPARSGSLLYVSRQRPLTMHEALVEYDERMIDDGLLVLARARAAFERGIVPDRPKEWRWTEAPCQWCPHKKLCKLDLKEGVTALEESNVAKAARITNPRYEYATVREAVLTRWHANQGEAHDRSRSRAHAGGARGGDAGRPAHRVVR